MGTTESAKPRGRLRRWLKWILILLLGPLLLVAGGVVFCNLWVVYSSSGNVYRDVDALVENDVALVLGTSPKVGPDRPNLHFENRLEAAALLFKRGKVRHLLVSGDNGTKYYNEPRVMKDALVALGVPKEAITSDFAGFRTFDSIVRAGKVFGLEKFTIVSDDFHVPRALFLARSQGLDAVALSSRVAVERSFKARSREWLARVKAVLDVYVLDAEPKFLGERVEIVIGRGVSESES